VQLLQIVDPAPVGEFDEPAAGLHYVAVELEIVNVGSTAHSDFVDSSAFGIDAAGQQYAAASFTETEAGPSFGDSLELAPGDRRSGFVLFELPDGATLSKVQVGADYGVSDEWVEFDVG
jgi:hypothetical protein